MLLTNLREYKSKEHSLKKIVKKVKPSMVMMNETLMLGEMKVSLNKEKPERRKLRRFGGD